LDGNPRPIVACPFTSVIAWIVPRSVNDRQPCSTEIAAAAGFGDRV
jgi:hypothetical protein